MRDNHILATLAQRLLLNTRAAVRAHFPIGIKRTMARGAHIAHLRVTQRAHHEIAVDRSATLGTNAIVRKLVFAKRDIEILLFSINKI